MKIILQPEDCCNIKMVSRFVQKQEFSIFNKHLGKGNLFAHTATQRSHAAGHVCDAKCAQNRTDLSFIIPEVAAVHLMHNLFITVLKT